MMKGGGCGCPNHSGREQMPNIYPRFNNYLKLSEGGEGKEEGERGNEKSAKLGINSNIYSFYQNR